MKMRLDRWLTTLGAGSRSEVKQWIRDGQVAVDGRTVSDPALSFDPATSRLALCGKQVDGRIIRHVMMHKSAGVLTAARDPKQPTVMDLLPAEYRSMGCMPVGRLDKDTTGILIFTCDGEMNHRLLSPGRHVDKCYRVIAEGRMDAEDVELFARGIRLSDFDALPAKLEILKISDPPETTLAEVTISEGKFHQVKRMFSAAGHEVLKLHRRSFGPLELDPELPEGAWRELTDDELRVLRLAAGLETAGGAE